MELQTYPLPDSKPTNVLDISGAWAVRQSIQDVNDLPFGRQLLAEQICSLSSDRANHSDRNYYSDRETKQLHW
jgi:hypothetical protein